MEHFQKLRTKQEKRMLIEHKKKKLATTEFPEQLMVKIKKKLKKYKPEGFRIFKNKEFVYMAILEKVQQFFEVNFQLFGRHAESGAGQTEEMQREVKAKLKKLFGRLERIAQKQEVATLRNENIRLFGLRQQFVDRKKLLKVKKSLKKLEREGKMNSRERALLKVTDVKIETFKNLGDASMKSASVETEAGESNRREGMERRATHQHRIDYNALNGQDEGQVQEEFRFTEANLKESMLKNDYRDMQNQSVSFEFSTNQVINSAQIDLDNTQQEALQNDEDLLHVKKRLEAKVKKKMGKYRARQAEENPEQDGEQAPETPEPDASEQIFNQVNERVEEKIEFNKAALEMVENKIVDEEVAQKLQNFYEQSNEVLADMHENMANVKETQKSFNSKCKSELRNMNMLAQIDDFVPKLNENNRNAIKSGNTENVMLPTFDLKYDCEKDMRPVTTLNRRQLTQEEKEELNLEKKTGFWGYVFGAVMIGIGIAISVYCGGPIWGFLASKCFDVGLRAIMENAKQNNDGTYDFGRIFSTSLKGVLSDTEGLKGLASNVCENIFGKSSGLGYDLSMFGVDMLFSENKFDTAMDFFKDKQEASKLDKEAQKKVKKRMKKGARKKLKKHKNMGEKIRKINEGVFEKKFSKYSGAINGNDSILKHIFNWVSKNQDKRKNQDQINRNYNGFLNNLYKSPQKKKGLLEQYKNKIYIDEDELEKHTKEVEALADKQIQAIGSRQNGPIDLYHHGIFDNLFSKGKDIIQQIGDQRVGERIRNQPIRSQRQIQQMMNDECQPFVSELQQNAKVLEDKLNEANLPAKILDQEGGNRKALSSVERRIVKDFDRDSRFSFGHPQLKSLFENQLSSYFGKMKNKNSPFYRSFQDKYDNYLMNSMEGCRDQLLLKQYSLF